MTREAVQAYAQGAGLLADAIRGLRAEDFGATPVPDSWSIGQIVLHLMDSDLILSDRMKRVIAEDNPTLIGFDQEAFSRSLSYDRQDPAKAAELFRLNREFTTVILQNLPDQAFLRIGTHNERGRLTLGELLDFAVKHLNHHLGFLRHKRQLLGKPL